MSKAKGGSVPTCSCHSCKLMDNSRMVQCDDCSFWYHFNCVGVTQDVEHDDWSCDKCQTVRSSAKSSKHHPPKQAQSTDMAPKGTQGANTRQQQQISNMAASSSGFQAGQVPKQQQAGANQPSNLQKTGAQKNGSSHNVVSQNWSCSESPETSQENAPQHPGTTNQSTLTKAQAELQLKLLDEQQALERKYLERRYQIIMQAAAGPSSELLGDQVNMFNSRLPLFQSSPISSRLRPDAQPFHPSIGLFNEATDFDQAILNRSQIAARQAVSKDLPSFSGDPEEWPLFFATFESTTKMCGYTPEENAVRLQRCLQGKAKEAVRSQLLHPSNVNSIISTLKMLFGRPEIVVHSLIQKIHALPAPKVEKLNTLVDFAVAVRNMVATVQACNLDDYLYNISLLQELVDRLPSMVKLNWAMHRQAMDRATLSDFSEWLYNLAEAASIVTIPPPFTPVDPKQRGGRKDGGFINSHCETSPSSTCEQKREVETTTDTKVLTTETKPKGCIVCGEGCYTVDTCKKFLGLDYYKRWSTLRELKLCRRCLKKHRGLCKSTTLCGKNECIFKHHHLLHNDNAPKPPGGNRNETFAATPSENPSSLSSGEPNCNTHRSNFEAVLFRYVPVVLHGRGVKISTYAFLDDGSSLTLLDDDLATELKLGGEPHPLCLRWTGDTCRYEESSLRVSVDISSVHNQETKYHLSDAHTVKGLNLPLQSLAFNKLIGKYDYLKDLPVESYTNVRPRILIGINHWRIGHVLESREGGEFEPIASKTRLGWLVYGTCNEEKKNEYAFHHSYHICSKFGQTDDDLHNAVKNYFALDSLGIMKSETMVLRGEDERAMAMMRSLTSIKQDRYQTGLLWKYDDVRLPNNKTMAMRRFHCLERRMAREPQLAVLLKLKIQDYLSKGYARMLTPAEVNEQWKRIWYLPMFPVFNPNKPGKLRIVWDAAAAVNGTSLNSVLMKGPDQLTELPSVLYRFREHMVAITGDIREMFHQVLMDEGDQQCQRFLWRSDETQNSPDVYVLKVMSFGATCSPSCAQFVKNENAERFRDRFPAAVEAVKKAHYVDDMLTSTESEAEAIELAKQVKLIHSHAGFEMRNWLSNSPIVLAALGTEPVPEKSLDITAEISSERVLGMWWSTSSDHFMYKVFTKRNEDILMDGKRPTKRQVLRTMMSIYDPLGLIANYLMFLKLLLQEIWRSGIDWDECIADKEWGMWQTWLQFLPKLEDLRIPRCYRVKTSLGPNVNIQLHTFVDASENGYAAVCYFRFEENGEVECALIGAKSRVAPLKFISIPRLELQAAVVGARLANSIEQGHTYTISQRFYWTDSRDSLCWLTNDHRRYSQYVEHRKTEILETTKLSNWRWVPSKLNVADDATKWKRAPSLEYESRWFNAPEFLWETEEIWPQSPIIGVTQEEIRPNLLHHYKVEEWILLPTDFSSWKRLQRTTATALRFPRNIRRKMAAQPVENGPFSAEELSEAANYLYRKAQEDVYYKERKLLANQDQLCGKKTISKSSPLFRVEPYLDEAGVMRMRGRIGECDYVDEAAKHPIILPRGHHLTLLAVQRIHCKFHHQCHRTVLNEVRQEFYIPRLRRVYDAVRRNCQACKIRLANPKPPSMADLPKARLAAFVRPFSYMGIDYFGPMQVKVGRRVEKRWGVLATCLTTRGVHIELAHSLTTDSCIMCIRNIMARRGVPVEIYSDRGTNLVGANNELKKALEEVNQDHLISEFTTEDTKWSFNPPASPHMGGSWERLIQSVKKILPHVIPTKRLPTDEVLKNALTEIENIINSRPLTYVPVDDEASPALTPNHFLLGSSNGVKPLVKYDDSGAALRKVWKSSQVLANVFWKKWLTEYLPEITRRPKWITPVRPIQVGDIVLIVDPAMPRNCWPKGRVVATKVAKDGQVRSAKVQTSSCRIYDRPAVNLAVLDVGANRSELDQGPATGGDCCVSPSERNAPSNQQP